MFLTLRSNDDVMILGSAIEPLQTRKVIKEFLLKVGNSFYRSPTQMKLEFGQDGTYQRKSK